MQATATMPQLIVSIDDASMIGKIRSAIKMIQGVAKVSVPRVRKTGLELAREDVRQGRVTHWNSAEEMFDTLMKD